MPKKEITLKKKDASSSKVSSPEKSSSAREKKKENSLAKLLRFFQEVKIEASRVTWPSRRETLAMTGVVLLLVVIATLFFFLFDTLIASALRWIFAAAA